MISDQERARVAGLRKIRAAHEMLIHASARLWKRGDHQASEIIMRARERMMEEWPLPTIEAHQRTCAQCRAIWQGVGLRV